MRPRTAGGPLVVRGLGVVGAVLAVVIAGLAPASSAHADSGVDTSAPIIDDITVSARTLPAVGGDVVVTITVGDESGVAGPVDVWFDSWQSGASAQTAHVSAVLQRGDAHLGTWVATVHIPSGATGNWELHVGAVADVAGNVLPATLGGQQVLVGYPFPPTELDAVAGGTGHVLHLSWPAANDNGDPLIRYEVWFGSEVIGTTTPDDREFDVDFATLPTWMQGDRFTIKSVNSVGWSDASPMNAPTATPAERPSPPADVRVVALEGAAQVQWSFPADRWTSAFTGVIATAEPGGATCTDIWGACYLQGLTPGRTYSVTVVGFNDVGRSLPTAPVRVVPVGFLTEPTHLVARMRPGDTSAMASWTPAKAVGLGDLQYTVSTIPASTTCSAWGPRDRSCHLDGLRSDTDYRFMVQIRMPDGRQGPASAAVDPTYYPRPDPPKQLAERSVLDCARFSWTAGAPRGYPITGYRLALRSKTGAVRTIDLGPDARSTTVPDLAPSVRWTATITESTRAGRSERAFGVRFTLPDLAVRPARPRAPAITRIGPDAATAHWSADSARTGTAVDRYQLVLLHHGRAVSRTTLPASARSRRLTGLRPDTAYEVEVRAHNHAGWAAWSKPRQVVTRSG